MITIVYFISLGFLDFLLIRECGFFIFEEPRNISCILLDAYSFQFYARNRTHTNEISKAKVVLFISFRIICE